MGLGVGRSVLSWHFGRSANGSHLLRHPWNQQLYQESLIRCAHLNPVENPSYLQNFWLGEMPQPTTPLKLCFVRGVSLHCESAQLNDVR